MHPVIIFLTVQRAKVIPIKYINHSCVFRPGKAVCFTGFPQLIPLRVQINGNGPRVLARVGSSKAKLFCRNGVGIFSFCSTY